MKTNKLQGNFFFKIEKRIIKKIKRYKKLKRKQ